MGSKSVSLIPLGLGHWEQGQQATKFCYKDDMEHNSSKVAPDILVS